MRQVQSCLVWLVFTLLTAASAFGQGSRLSLNAGLGMGFNQGRTSDLADTSGSLVAGAGYRFTDVIVTRVEYQYYNLDIKSAVNEQSGEDTDIGHVDSVTTNLLIQPNNRLHMYGIAGLGWY